MCGICGLVAPEGDRHGPLAERIEAMAHTLHHRGPDGSGHWCDPAAPIALGQTRLAVQDPSAAGEQPMLSSCGRYVVVFNGELYGFHALRRELEQAGRPFRGGSDTEVLTEAIGAWGVDAAFARIDGMFAIAVWDTRERALHLARDAVGKKPLYFARRGGALWFGSELKALRADPGFAAEIDPDSLAHFVRFSFVPAPRTIFAGVEKLEAGAHVSFDVSRGVGEPRRRRIASVRAWAEQGEREPFTGTPAEALDALDARLRDAVARRLVSDVPLGALLSGGIDSSLVVATMRELSKDPVETFSIGFREASHDESAHARKIAAHLGTDHHELIVTPKQARDVIPRLPVLYDEPFADTSQIPTALVCALARERVTVALSGDGGDEGFGGYTRYAHCLARDRRLGHLPYGVRRGLAAAARAVAPLRLERVHEALLARDVEAQFAAACARHPADVALVPGATGVSEFGTGGASGLADPLARLTTLDLATRLPESILVKVDRASMGVGLEVRCPLLDREVLRFALRLPASLRIRDGVAKWPLRALLERRVPRALFDRPKQGFGVPIGAWLSGPLRDWTEAQLDPQRLREEGHLDPVAVRRIWDQHQRGAPDRTHLVWNLVAFQSWLARGA